MSHLDFSRTAHAAGASEAEKPSWFSLCGSAALDEDGFVEGFETCLYPSTEFRHPSLKDKNSLAQFYSNDLLMSDRARQEWVEPNLKLLPV